MSILRSAGTAGFFATCVIMACSEAEPGSDAPGEGGAAAAGDAGAPFDGGTTAGGSVSGAAGDGDGGVAAGTGGGGQAGEPSSGAAGAPEGGAGQDPGTFEPTPVVCTPPLDLVDVSTPDRVVGTGTSASCSEGALATALSQGGIITFDCGGPKTIRVTQTLMLNTSTDTVLDGGGIIALDGHDAVRILGSELEGGVLPTVTLQRLSFLRGRAPVVQSNQTTGCSEDGVEDQDGIEYAGSSGGAVQSFLPMHIIDCSFIDNRAATCGPNVGGGALYLHHPAVVVGSRFVGNTGAQGGAIYATGDLTLVNSQLSDNAATGEQGLPVPSAAGGEGGAVWLRENFGGELSVCGSVLAHNSAKDCGALYHDGLDVMLSRSSFDANMGGGLCLEAAGSVTIERCSVSNSVGIGVWIGQSLTTVENTTFYANTTSKNTLGAALQTGAETTIRNATFVNNSVTGPEGEGGSIKGLMTISNTLFVGNTSSDTDKFDQCGSVATGTHNLQWPRKRDGGSYNDRECTPGIVFADPELGTFQDHGGPTWTLVPTAAAALGQGSDCPDHDQRGEPRGVATCTIGAVEP